MSNKPRMIVPNVFYEVTTSCIPELKIFSSESLKVFFLEQLLISLKKYSFKCYSWSIMDDHYHLVLKSSDYTISRFMKRFNSVLAKKYNKSHNRHGTAFSRKFSSVIVQREGGLEDVIRFVHLNPVRRKECTAEELDQYRWSGHNAIVNGIEDEIIDIEEIKNLFGSIEKYRGFMQSGKLDCSDDEIIKKVRNAHRDSYSFTNPESWVIGDEEYVRKVIEQNMNHRVRLARYVVENVTLDSLLDKVAACINRERKELLHLSGRMNEISTARELFAFIGVSHFGYSCISLASYLGVTGSAVSRMISRSCRINELDYLKEMVCT
jgi:putative transposase